MLYREDREAGRGTELKHTHFTTPPSLHPHPILIHSALSDAVPLSSQKSSLFSLQKTCREERRRREEEKKRVGGDKGERERERKQRKLVVEREGEERGVDQMEGRKEGKDLSKGSSA